MEKRIEIIKEIKALSNIKDLQTNKFDPTETMNTGLLCEMSLIEVSLFIDVIVMTNLTINIIVWIFHFL